MIMPFARLIAIYLVVGLAVFAFFKRDELTVLIYGPEVETINVSELMEQQAAAAPTPAPAPVAPEITPPTAPEITPPTPPEADDMQTRWDEARKAFWEGDKETAEAAYTALVAEYPNEAGIAGELGNLYYNTGRYDAAAKQFHIVGKIALEAGNKAEAMAMIGVLQSLAPELAAELRTIADAQN